MLAWKQVVLAGALVYSSALAANAVRPNAQVPAFISNKWRVILFLVA